MPDPIERSVGAQASDEGTPMYGESGSQSRRACALVLAGGIALGAYEAGALAALEKAGDPPVEWIAGSSIGAVTAAIIASNPPERRLERLLPI
jgi:NTE family protein